MQIYRVMDCISNIEVMLLEGWSVVHVVRNTLGEIVYRIKVVGLRYIVNRRRRLLGMWGRVFLVFMLQWTKNKQNTIEMEGKLCDQVISILIDLGSNYSYVSPNLVDKCGLSKDLHAESWLVQWATGTLGKSLCI